jgi:hypothetical protein
MRRVVRESAALDLHLIHGDDDYFEVVHAGTVLQRTKVQALAEIIYQETHERVGEGFALLRQRERDHYTMQAVRSDSFARRSSKVQKKGGRGGRGGV